MRRWISPRNSVVAEPRHLHAILLASERIFGSNYFETKIGNP